MSTRTDPDSDQPTSRDEAAGLSSDEVRSRAAGGAVLVGLRGGAIQIVGLAANVFLARMLAPRDFGIVALGNAVLVFGSLMANSGVAAGLIRRLEPPDRDDLRAVVAFQLALTVALAAVVAVTAIPFGGKAGLIAAAMAAPLPLMALRSPAAIMLERSLSYRRLVVVEIVETLAYYVWAVAAVALGWGVWGLATAVSARIVSGTVLLLVTAPVGLVLPRWSTARLRPLLGFGAKLQATAAATFVRDQGFNVVVGAVAGLATLGLWTLAFRALSIPMVLFQALWRVSYPGMARLLALGEDARPVLERIVGLTAAACGAVLVVMAASAPALVPAVFGARWADAADAVPLACLGFMVGGPISVAAAGYLNARGDAGTGLRASAAHTAVQFAVAVPLLPSLGLWAIGLGMLASALTDAVILGRAAARDSSARLLRALAGPLAVAVVCGAAGWLAVDARDPTLAVGLGGGALALALYLAGLALLPGRVLADTLATARRAVSSAR